MSHHVNIVRIKGIYNALGDLKDKVAFVGGATVSLYADYPQQIDVRPTNDIDVLVEIGTYGEYAQLLNKLSALNFHPDPASNVICRYKYQGLIVDIMPIDEAILGFSNKWYKEGFAHLQRYSIDSLTEVNIFTPPYFIASKMEAYKGRGGNDGRFSQDFEDIVFILDNRKTVWMELKEADRELTDYLKLEFMSMLANPHLDEWLSVHLEYQTADKRARWIMNAMQEFVS